MGGQFFRQSPVSSWASVSQTLNPHRAGAGRTNPREATQPVLLEISLP